jgi:hypothetical protein
MPPLGVLVEDRWCFRLRPGREVVGHDGDRNRREGHARQDDDASCAVQLVDLNGTSTLIHVADVGEEVLVPVPDSLCSEVDAAYLPVHDQS